MTFVLASQFHIYLPWVTYCPFCMHSVLIVSKMWLVSSRHFQSDCKIHDCKTSRRFVSSSSAQRRYSDGLIGPYLMQVGERGHTLSLGALALAALVALVALVPPPAWSHSRRVELRMHSETLRPQIAGVIWGTDRSRLQPVHTQEACKWCLIVYLFSNLFEESIVCRKVFNAH